MWSHRPTRRNATSRAARVTDTTRSMPRVVLVCSLVVLAIVADARPARACSTCTVGDPTLTVMGAEQPTDGRLRFSSSLRWRRERVEQGHALVERRVELGVAWSPIARVTFSVGVPIVSRRARFPNLAEERSLGLGDVDVRARVMLFRDRELAPRHLFAAVLGLELPTAVRSAGPYEDDPEHQPGTRSWDPIVGLTYGWFAGPWSMHALAVLLTPASEGVGGVRGGPSLRGSMRAQWQPWTVVGFALAIDGRVDGREHVDGVRDDATGGAVFYGGGGVVLAPSEDVVFDLRLSVPVWQRLRGGHVEGVVAFAGVTIDV